MQPARWCDEHRWWECVKKPKRPTPDGLCHGPVLGGTDACRMHIGKTTAQALAEVEARRMLADAVAETPRSHPGEVLLKAGHAAHVLLDRMLEATPSEAPSVAQLELLVTAIDRAARIAKAALDADAADRWVKSQEALSQAQGAEFVEALQWLVVEATSRLRLSEKRVQVLRDLVPEMLRRLPQTIEIEGT